MDDEDSKIIDSLEAQQDAIKAMLFEDFQSFTILFLWKDWMENAYDKSSAASKFITIWKDKAIEQHEEKMKEYRAKLESSNSVIQMFMQEAMPSPEEVSASYHEALNDVVIELKAIAKTKPLDDDGEVSNSGF